MKNQEQRPLLDAITAMEAGIRSMGVQINSLPADEVVLLRMLLMVAPVLLAGFAREVRKHAAIGETEFRTLAVLFSREDGAATPSELCSFDTHGRANMTRIGDVLVAQGLASRSIATDDRRRVVLRITPRGRKLVTRIVPKLMPGLGVVFAGISDARKTQLAAVLKRVAANIDVWARSQT